MKAGINSKQGSGSLSSAHATPLNVMKTITQLLDTDTIGSWYLRHFPQGNAVVIAVRDGIICPPHSTRIEKPIPVLSHPCMDSRSQYTLVIYFLIYSMIGWGLEVIYCLLIDGEFTNRGFSFGPYCPIYGFAAALIVNVLHPRTKSPIILFGLAMLACTIMEYLTSWIMEATLHVKLWDYSSYPLNFGGRVCLLNSFLFGLLAIWVVYQLQPAMERLVTKIPVHLRRLLCYMIVLVVLADFMTSSVLTLRDPERIIIPGVIQPHDIHGAPQAG